MKHDFSDIKNKDETELLGSLYPIILCEHNPEYKKLYEIERDFLLGVFGDKVVRISHIGSTAVPGLTAKPTVDILLEIKENTDLSHITDYLTKNGYIVNRPSIDIVLYIKGYTPKGFEGQAYHIHVRNSGDHNELYFRDYLIAHPDIAKQYGELKQGLKEKFEHDRDGYTEAKSEFIKKYTKAARAEFANKYNPG